VSTSDDRPGAQLPSYVAAAWGLKDRPSRGPRPALSVERIVEAAVALADAEGLGAVSMNRVASALGASPMALYRHVASKDDLVALMVDAAYGPVPPRADGEDWRAGLSRWAHALLAAAQAHPWAMQVPVRGLPMAPNEVAWFEDALASQAGTGLTHDERASVVLMISGYVRNHVVVMADVHARLTAIGPTPDDAMRAHTEQLRRLLDPERFPATTALISSDAFERADPPEQEFAFGLERLLDGVGVLVRSRAAD
jgi:AcrR family transcriptional regulator